MRLKFEKARWAWDQDGCWLSILVPNPQMVKKFVGEMKGTYSAEIKEWRERRSLDANAYFHVLCRKIAEIMNLGLEEVKTGLVVEYGAVERDEDGAKVGFKLPASVDVSKIYRYVKLFDTRIENGKEFNCYIVFKHTHLMDTKEMSRLIDGAVYEAKNLGIETLPPERIKLLMEEWNGRNMETN